MISNEKALHEIYDLQMKMDLVYCQNQTDDHIQFHQNNMKAKI